MANFGLSVHDGDLKYTAPDGEVIDVAEAGSGIMYVNFTLDESSGEDVYSADKTFAEVVAAIDVGKIMVMGIYSGDNTDFFYCPLQEYNDDYSVKFQNVSFGSDGFMGVFTLTIGADDTVTGEHIDCNLSSLIVEE